jgi:nicotinate-nucleotide adenylyltransferase
LEKIQKRVSKVFNEAFGRTPLKQRLDDILGEVIELTRYSDDKNLNEETGDALASLIALCDERGLDFTDLVEATLSKIERRKVQYNTLGRKVKVAILGGAFDPIHPGHILVAKFVLNTSKEFDEVWLMPAYEHMHGKNMAPANHRLAMCELAAKSDGRIKVFDYEIRNKLSGETYQTIKLLQEEKLYKDKYHFSLIIGQDNANTFDKWVNYIHLEKLIRFVVVPRKGVAPDPKVNWYFKPPHIYLPNDEKHTLNDKSSTEIRKMLSSYKRSVETSAYLDYDVHNYIIKKGLYKGKI